MEVCVCIDGNVCACVCYSHLTDEKKKTNQYDYIEVEPGQQSGNLPRNFINSM